MKFSEFEYKRPQMGEIREKFMVALESFKRAESYEEQIEAMKEINKVRDFVSTMYNLVLIRHSIDTNDEYYKTENDFFDDFSPEMEELTTAYYAELVRSKYRKELEGQLGGQLFALAEGQLKTFKPEIIPHLQRENKLSSEYSQLIASAKINFEGEQLTLAQLQPYMESSDRDRRRRASEAYYGFFTDNQAELDRIFDELVQVRNKMAIALGFENFVELGYYRMSRTDYNADMVQSFRKQVEEEVVPLVTKLRESQKGRLGIDTLYYYDENFQFKSGNPVPKGEANWIIDNGERMYKELSPETDEFFQFMVHNDLMDLIAKKGKESGGYCTFIEDYKAPFIFSNFNGTAGDIDVLTHEAGHAFQVYRSRNLEMPEFYWATNEASEIHSMSMEFLTWPWMNLFFKEDTEKYKYAHLSGGLIFLPYGVAVDEFQHFVYENPTVTAEERNAAWRRIEKKYLPHRNYENNEFLEKGGYWQRQSHIYQVPFILIMHWLRYVHFNFGKGQWKTIQRLGMTI